MLTPILITDIRFTHLWVADACNPTEHDVQPKLLLSLRNQSWRLKLDYASGIDSGNILWNLGLDGDFTLLGGDLSQWFYDPHYPNILTVDGSQTTLAIHDDGNDRAYSDGSSCASGGARVLLASYNFSGQRECQRCQFAAARSPRLLLILGRKHRPFERWGRRIRQQRPFQQWVVP